MLLASAIVLDDTECRYEIMYCIENTVLCTVLCTLLPVDSAGQSKGYRAQGTLRKRKGHVHVLYDTVAVITGFVLYCTVQTTEYCAVYSTLWTH
jgi:hypothetical protein